MSRQNWNPRQGKYNNPKGKTRHDQAVRRAAADKTPKAWLDPATFYAIPQPKPVKREDDDA